MLRKFAGRQSSKFLLLILVLSCCSVARSQKATKLWSVDLSNDPDFHKRLDADVLLLRPPTVDFLNNNQVIVAFDDGTTSLGQVLVPFGFHVLDVQVASGAIGKRLSFPALTDTSQAEAIDGGGFVVLAGEELSKYSSSFEKTASMPAPLKLHGQPTEQNLGYQIYWNPRYERWNLDVAPTGKTLVLTHSKDLQEIDVLSVATSNLQPTAQNTLDYHLFSDREDAGYAGNHAVLLRDPSTVTTKWLVSSDNDKKTFCADCYRAFFITDKLVFSVNQMPGHPHTQGAEARISDMDNHILQKWKLHVDANSFHRSMQADRFSYLTGTYKGSGFPLRTHFAAHMEVVVFDWDAMKQVASISFDEPEKAVSSGFRESAAALSPDGKELVVLANETLSCYRLP